MKYKHFKMVEPYRNIAISLFGEIWINEIKNVDRYDDIYKCGINMFNPYIKIDKFLNIELFNGMDLQWYESLDEYFDEEFDLFMYEYSNLKNVINDWNILDTNEKKIDYLVKNNHILYKRLFDDTHMIHII